MEKVFTFEMSTTKDDRVAARINLYNTMSLYNAVTDGKANQILDFRIVDVQELLQLIPEYALVDTVFDAMPCKALIDDDKQVIIYDTEPTLSRCRFEVLLKEFGKGSDQVTFWDIKAIALL